MAKRLRRDETTADQIEEGDLISPPNRYGRVTVHRKGSSDRCAEPNVTLGYSWPNDFSVNESHRGQSSGHMYRPDDPVTRWV